MTSEARATVLPKTILAHDYLTQRGGAERVALELYNALGADRVVTSLYSPEKTFSEFSSIEVEPSALNLIPAFRRDPRLALPFLSSSWTKRPPVEAEAIVCSSSGWAHAMPVSGNTKKIVYCHNPARWLYQEADYLLDQPPLVQVALRALRPMLLDFDQRAARSCDLYVANSSSVAARIRKAYGIEPEIVFPPVSVDVQGSLQSVPGIEGPYFLTIGRVRGYKGTHILVDAFRRLKSERLVIVGETFVEDCPENIFPLGFVSEENLRWLYKNARALVSVSREDFGLTPIEANAFGTPTLLLRAGGFIDSMREGVSGRFIETASWENVVEAVLEYPEDWDTEAILEHADLFSPEKFSTQMNEIVARVVSFEKIPSTRPVL